MTKQSQCVSAHKWLCFSKSQVVGTKQTDTLEETYVTAELFLNSSVVLDTDRMLDNNSPQAPHTVTYCAHVVRHNTMLTCVLM